MGLLLVYPAVLGGEVLGPEDMLLFKPPLQSVRPSSLLLPSNYLYTDPVEVFHPDLQWARGMLRSGHLPLWNPDIFAGWPQLASQQTAMLFPLSAVAYALPFWSSLGIIVVLKFCLAGWGMWLLCRALGLRAASRWVAAMSYGIGSYFVMWLEHPHTNVWLMMPWLLLAVRGVTRRGDRRAVAFLAACVGLTLLAGHPESVFIVGLMALGFAAQELTGPGAVLAGSRRTIFSRLVAGTALGGLCGLVVVVPFFEQLGQAIDAARGGGNLPRSVLLTTFLPDLWGRPDHLGSESPGIAINYAERNIYIGALPLLLAVAGLYRSRWREQRFFVLALLGAIILAIQLPGLGGLPRLPLLINVNLSRALIVVSFSLAVLAAYGLESYLSGNSAHRRRLLQIAAVVALLPLGWAFTHSGVLSQLPHFGDLAPNVWGRSVTPDQAAAGALTRWIVAAAVGLALLALLARGRRVALVLALLLVWCTVDLLALNHGYHPAVPRGVADPGATASIAEARATQGHGRIVGYGAYLPANVGARFGLRDVRGHGLPANRRYFSLFTGLGGSGFQASSLPEANPTTGRLLDTFGVSLLLAGPTDRPSLPQLQLSSATPDGRVYRNTTALPRAYLASDWTPASSQAAALAATLQSSTRQLRAAPVIETTGTRPARPSAGVAPSRVAFETDGANEVRLNVRSDTGGYLVLLDSYYPGWHATVDGRAASIEAANGAFRAVKVPAGSHHVLFRYRPASILVSGSVSLIAWLIVVLLAILPRRWARRSDRDVIRP